MVKIPATAEGIGPIRTMIAEGRNTNVTLIFSLDRYREVINAYLDGLEAYAAQDGTELGTVASVASFFISRVDTEVDRRLEQIGSPEALALRGKAAIAQGKLAYRLFTETFSGERWEALAARGAKVQRPLWASTSTKNEAYPDTMYVDNLIGPFTVNTLPDATIEAFNDHGTLERTVDRGVDEAEAVWQSLADVGVDLDDVADQLEREGVASFQKSFHGLIDALDAKVCRARAPSSSLIDIRRTPAPLVRECVDAAGVVQRREPVRPRQGAEHGDVGGGTTPARRLRAVQPHRPAALLSQRRQAADARRPRDARRDHAGEQRRTD